MDKRFDLDKLDTALRDAYRSWDDLHRLLFLKLGWRLEDLVREAPLRIAVPRLLDYTEGCSRTGELVDAAYHANPTNSKLKAFYEEAFSLSAASPSALERITRELSGFLSFREIVEAQQRILRQVCRVDIDGQAEGTGFLVGPSLVLTNYHVVEGDQGRPVDPGAIKCRFDFAQRGSGVTYSLSDQGILLLSPWSRRDDEDDPKPDPDPSELDFALLELDEPIGDERGFIQLGKSEVAFQAGAPLFIVQHPNGRPMEVALDTEAILETNRNRTRVRYRTNTLPGSSGSPCFNARWELVALHHSGDPRPHRKGKVFGRYNQGIPIDRIRKCIEEAKLSQLLEQRRSPRERTDPQRLEVLREALLSAFASHDALVALLTSRLGWKLGEIDGSDSFANLVSRVLERAESTQQTKRLLQAAQEQSPGNTKLRECYWTFFGSESAQESSSPPGRDAPPATASAANAPFKLVYHCAPEDSLFGAALEKQLTGLVKAGLIERPWSEAAVAPGAVRQAEIDKHWGQAHVIVLLVSANLLADGDAYLEMAKREREKRGAQVIPVIVRAALWESSWLGALSAYPYEDRAVKPIARWSDSSDAWLNVITALKKLLEGLRETRAQGPGPRPGA